MKNKYEDKYLDLGGKVGINSDNLIILENWNENSIIFNTAEKREIIKLCSNGDIYVKGKLIENDIEVVNGLREFLKGSKNEHI